MPKNTNQNENITRIIAIMRRYSLRLINANALQSHTHASTTNNATCNKL